MSKEQTALERIRNEVVKEKNRKVNGHIIDTWESYTSIFGSPDWLNEEVAKRFALECCQATIENVEKNLKYTRDSFHYITGVDKSSITNKDNIVIL